MRRLALALVCALFFGGCANSYYYTPAEQANATVSGYPAARYVIPEGTNQGDVRVSTFGVKDLRLNGDEEEAVRSLHVRLIVANQNGTQDWSVDTRNIQVQYTGIQGQRAPAFANANDRGMPVVVVPPGASRTIDLYYPLPPEISGAKDLPQFDVVWAVQTDNQVVAERTPFERRKIEPAPAYGYGYGVGFGAYPYWWYDPWFYGGFYGRPLVIQGRGGAPRPHVTYYPRR